VELEIRQDLLMCESDLQSWSERLAAVLEGALPTCLQCDTIDK